MFVDVLEIVKRANRIYDMCETREPYKIAEQLGIEVLTYPFKCQKGAYKVIMRNRFIFIKKDLSHIMENIVLLHEIGHDTLYRNEAVKAGGFKEFDIFAMQDRKMEYEANIFVAQFSLPDDEFLEYCELGYHTANRHSYAYGC